MDNSENKKTCASCGTNSTPAARVPITLRDLFWQDPFFSSNWGEFHDMHDTMMRETRDVWKKFDEQLKHFEAKTPEPISEDVQAPGWFFPKRLMRLPSIFNDEATKDMFKDDQQIQTKSDEKGFEVSLDTSLYRPDEIKVNVDKNNVLTVEANHEDKAEDGNKHVSRHFMRKYTLPEGCKAEAVNSNLSSDGVLLITAPKLVLEAPSVKNVPIMQN